MKLFLFFGLILGSTAYRHRQVLPRSTCLDRNIPDFYSSISAQNAKITKLAASAVQNALPGKKKNSLNISLESATNLFPLWVLSASLLGNINPSLFQWFSPYITPALALTMMTMGMTLTFEDFKRVAAKPQFIFLGFIAQYLIMPLSAAFISKAFKLTPELSSGLILVGCAPGGTASNLVTMIAQADLPLSVVMTAASTFAAVFMTPFLTAKLAGSYVKVKAMDLVMSSLNVVLAPVLAGICLNSALPQLSKKIAKYTPFASVLLVSMICGTVSATNSGVAIGIPGFKLILAVASLHLSGFFWGYLLARLVGAGERRSRTISIETGMQNSALACVLAQHFPNPQLCALPGSISATCHSVIGSLLAAYWRRRAPSDTVK